MYLLLTALAVATSVLLLNWIGLRDTKRLHTQHDTSASRQPFSYGQRRLLAMGAATPGVLLMLGGWGSAAVMWLGGTVTLAWLSVLWLGRSRQTPIAATIVGAGQADRTSG